MTCLRAIFPMISRRTARTLIVPRISISDCITFRRVVVRASGFSCRGAAPARRALVDMGGRACRSADSPGLFGKVLMCAMVLGLVSCSASTGTEGSARGASPGDARPASSDRSSNGSEFFAQHEADEALAQFDRDNPECPIWTNWQKVCSRAGLDGSTECHSDPDLPVAPSAPFCVRTEFSGVSPPSESQRQSSLRFCASTYDERVRNTAGDVLFEGKLCGQYEVNRPFNGRRLPARLHAACARWTRNADGLLECSEWQMRSCNLNDGIPRRRPPDSGEHIIIPGRFDPERTAVFSVFCV
jgi:hypothetical protein